MGTLLPEASGPFIIMDVATDKALYTLEDIGLYSLVTFSPDGLLLITGSTIRDPTDGKILPTHRKLSRFG